MSFVIDIFALGVTLFLRFLSNYNQNVITVYVRRISMGLNENILASIATEPLFFF